MEEHQIKLQLKKLLITCLRELVILMIVGVYHGLLFCGLVKRQLRKIGSVSNITFLHVIFRLKRENSLEDHNFNLFICHWHKCYQ